MYTDGSLLDNNQAGSAFVIPALKMEKSFYVGKHRSVFTAELTAILMALTYILDHPFCIFRISLCVDSKSALYALKSSDCKKNSKLVLDIKNIVHFLSLRGITVAFCWIPSHIGLHANEWADRAAKKGASNENGSIKMHIPLSIQESYRLLEHTSMSKFQDSIPNNKCIFEVIHQSNIHSNAFRERQLKALFFRIRLNAFITKFSKNVKCLCGEGISNTHVFECQNLKPYLPAFPENSIEQVLDNVKLMFDIAKGLLHSPIGHLL